MKKDGDIVIEYALPRRSRRLSVLAVGALMWGLFASPIMAGIFRAIEFLQVPCPYPSGDEVICSVVTGIGIVMSALSLLRIVPGISPLRGVWYSVGGIVAAGVSWYPGMMLIYLLRASSRW